MSHFPKGGKAGPHSLHTAEAWDHWGFGQAWGGAFWGRERFLWKSFGQVIETVQHSQWDCCIERRTWTDKLDWRLNRKRLFYIFTEMRFRFCGGEDCPDWLLAEISSLAAVSVVKVRQITAEVSELSCRNYESWIHSINGICFWWMNNNFHLCTQRLVSCWQKISKLFLRDCLLL